MVLLLIAGIPVTMILTATWLWYFVVQGDLDLVGVLGTANRGTLVQPPRQLDDSNWTDAGVEFKHADLEPKWAMLVAVPGVSAIRAANRILYMTRQIHVAMGKDFNRIRRLVISETPPADTRLTSAQLSDERPAPGRFHALLRGDHRGSRTLTVQPGGYARLFPEYRVDPSTWYLVDPAGWVMMSYNSEIPYKEVISDLKFLLKNSGE